MTLFDCYKLFINGKKDYEMTKTPITIDTTTTMNTNLLTLEYDKIINMLVDFAVSDQAKEKLAKLVPYLREDEAKRKMDETTQGRRIFDYLGNPPLTTMQQMSDILMLCEQEGILLPEQLTIVMQFLISCKRLKRYLERGNDLGLALTSYSYSIEPLEELYEELNKSIYNNRVDDSASTELRDIRRKIDVTENAIKQKLDTLLRSKKEYFSDSYVSTRNGHNVLPVKKEYKHQIAGSVIDMSATGSTYFIEPTVVTKLQEEINSLRVMEENEIRKILYILTSFVTDSKATLATNMEIMESLDIIFAKAKLSAHLDANEVIISSQPTIKIINGRHPLINREECVPLNFTMEEGTTGVVITGPNTGGKTVSLKTVGLLSTMAQSGLHIPASKESQIAMHNTILCDIGDGQSITQNLSTFSAHIKNVIHILQTATVESLVLLDELGSGTDPAEGMGIAIAILEELRNIPCRFIATTHYPEVKEYVSKSSDLINARMAFDPVSLKPLYQLIIGEAGESCALYIAKQLGLPAHMLNIAYQHAYKTTDLFEESPQNNENSESKKKSQTNTKPKLIKSSQKHDKPYLNKYSIGDSVIVYPQKILGIVYEVANAKGEVGVQIRGKKQLINYKRVKIKTPASELYPEGYDFSILFDSVELRKTRHQTNRKYKNNTTVIIKE